MLAAAVRAAADLDVHSGERRDEVRALEQVIGEQAAEAARLRDRQLARFGARAARDVGERAGTGTRQAGRRETLVEGLDVRCCAPSGTPGSDRSSRAPCRRRRSADSSPSRRICADVRSPSTVVTMTIEKPACFCGRTLVRDQSTNSSAAP